MKNVRGWIAVVAIAVIAAGIAVPAAWRAASDDIRDQVFVRMDDRAFECENPDDVTAVPLEIDDSEPELRTPAVRASPGLNCTFSFFVQNESESTVVMSAIKLPFMGGSNGNGLHAGDANPNMIAQKYRESIDGVYDLTTPSDYNGGPWELPPGESMKWEFPLEWSDGCVVSGGYIQSHDAPIVGITALGLGGTVHHSGPSYAVVGTGASEC